MKKSGSTRFVEGDKGAVQDNNTGLMWLTNANISKSPVPLQTAKQYIQDMNSGALPNYGFTNWRLPTIGDLESLLDNTQSSPALPPSHPFENVQNGLYWSSSTGIDIIEFLWTLDMASGKRNSEYPSYCLFRFFWPVRNTLKFAEAHLGRVFTSGMNRNGQLGDGAAEDRASFMPVEKLSNIIKAVAGVQHVIALGTDGNVWVWGDNNDGQLGLGPNVEESRVPVRVEGLRAVMDVAAGMSQSIALKTDGTVWAWGDNSLGQLGAGEIDFSQVPVHVNGLSEVTKIVAGMNHSLAVKADGTVWAWGDNSLGQLGAGDINRSRVPVQVKGMSQVVKIIAGMNHSLAVKADGTVWAWGDNSSGQLGDGTYLERRLPVQVAGLFQVVDIAAGQNHSLALKADGTVWVWGSNKYSQLGTLGSSEATKATLVERISNVRKIAAGSYHSIALQSDGMISYWGKYSNRFDGKSHPYTVNYIKDIFDVSAGKYFTIFLSEQTQD